MKIPFNIPFISGSEGNYVNEVINKLPGSDRDTYYDRCRTMLKQKWNFNEVFLTNSCTSALEVCALLLEIKPDDEVIVPSYTFPSTASAFIRQGATIVFADSRNDHPGIDENKIGSLITEKTRAIVAMHYGGVACDMDRIMNIAKNHDLYVIEDAALAFDSYYKSRPLGTIGHLGCLSFHQTKNIQCGEGGALVINDARFLERIWNILEKGTNRNEFIFGKVQRYEWVEIGSSFLMSEMHAGYFYAQLEKAEWIKEQRTSLWSHYYESLQVLEEKGLLKLPFIPEYAGHNAHTFYLVLNDQKEASRLMVFLKNEDIQATVHYTSLDQSIFWKKNHLSETRNSNSFRYNDCLIRLPLYNSMSEVEVEYVANSLLSFYNV
jgi:dTDP-4-amino-4,6-dideoxygalactose transaminase